MVRSRVLLVVGVVAALFAATAHAQSEPSRTEDAGVGGASASDPANGDAVADADTDHADRLPSDSEADEAAAATSDGDAPATEAPLEIEAASSADDDPWDETLEPDDDLALETIDGPQVRYLLEDVRVEGETRVRPSLLRDFVPFERGDVVDPETSDLEDLEWAIRGTGWFGRVDVRLERGSRRGWVDLVIEVEDQNTVVVQQFTVGVSEGLSSTRAMRTDVLPYVGFSISDSNILGRGHGFSITGLMSERQQAMRFGLQVPSLGDTRMTLRSALSLHNGREFYGNQPFVSATCDPMAPPGCADELEARNAVVFYRRTSATVGVGRTIGTNVHVALDWVFDVLYVTSMPEAASELRYGMVVPIDFAVANGRSLVSSLRLSLTYDRRDEPNLTRRGALFRAQAEVGSRLFGSRYDYSRVQVTLRGYVPLPRGQVLRFGGFLGVATGSPPFFLLFHVSDLTDFIPSRVLEMDIDRRGAPDLLGTAIAFQRAEEFAARLDVQYEVALQRGHSGDAVRGVNGFLNLGVYALSDLGELSLAPSGVSGLDRLPIDLTFDVGVRVDTDIGLFELGFSNLFGFIDPR